MKKRQSYRIIETAEGIPDVLIYYKPFGNKDKVVIYCFEYDEFLSVTTKEETVNFESVQLAHSFMQNFTEQQAYEWVTSNEK